MAPSSAFAAGGGGGLGSLWLPFVNFTLYAIALTFLYKKYGANLLRQRSIEIREKLQAASIALADATEARNERKARLDDIDEEKAGLVRRYEAEGVSMSEAIIENAKAQSARIERDAQRQVDVELQQAKKRLHNEAVQAAIGKARTQLEQGLSEEQDRLLRKGVVQELILQARG